MDKKAMTPLIATSLLVVFSLIIGFATMNWGRAYVEKINIEDKPSSTDSFKNNIILSIDDINTPLKEIQISHIKGEISEDQYFEQEKGLINP